MNRRKMGSAGTIALVGVVGSLAIGGIATGTPSSGVSASTVTARGTAEDKVLTRGHEAYDVVMHNITIQPGGHSGWHSHPGQAIVVIKSGTFTTYSAKDKKCTATTYGPGEVYVDPGYGASHIARNEGTVPTELQVTYLDVPVGQPFRFDTPAPGNCPF